MIPPSGATVNDETDGTAPALDDTPGSYADITLSKHKSVMFGFSQVAETLDGGRSIPVITEARMADLFNSIETDVASLALTFSNSVGTGNTALTEATYDAGRALLVAAQVPENDPLWGVYHYNAKSWQALAALATFREYRIRGEVSNVTEVTEYGVKPTMWKSAYHVESQNVATATVSASTYTYNYLMHRSAILVAMKAPVLPSSPGVEAANFMDPDSGIEFQILKYFDQTKHGDVLKIHSLYGKGLGRADWGCILLA
jgi:hypothetical protein